MEYKKNDLVQVLIEDMSDQGEGIGRAGGFTLFVKDAVAGDLVEARITRPKKNYAYARVEKVLTPSPFRVEPKCPVHRPCGGCQLQALDYGSQLSFKQEKVRNNLVRIGGFDRELVDRILEPIVGMENPWRYRNKAQYPVGADREGRPVAGFYAKGTHSIIPCADCLLGPEINSRILETVLTYMRENRVEAYREETGKGQVRHILIRSGFSSGQIMVCLVICSPGEKLKREGKFLPAQEELTEALARIPGMTSVSVSINDEQTNVIMGREVRCIWGEPAIRDVIRVRDMSREGCPPTGRELAFQISPLSFYQVNPLQTEKLYSLALEYAGLTGRETVWDLYCGIGTISLFLAGRAKKVYGVEIVPRAVEDAQENARRNGIGNASFFAGRAEEVLPRYYEQGEDAEGPDRMRHPDVIVVDPPRKGCDSACLETILKMRPDRIVYVSCDSATLARDAKLLCQGGYRLERARPVDQFGQTVHVECVVLMSRVEGK